MLEDKNRVDPSESGAIGILGTGSYVPDRVVSNEVVGAPAGVDDAWIQKKTKIRERRWAAPDQATSDLATAAARMALEAAGVSASELTTIVLATSTPDRPQPPTAAYVQNTLGADCAAFDINAVCSGFVFALEIARSLIRASGGYVLAIGAEVYSRILDPYDRKTVVLLGDGAGAAVIGPVSGTRGFHDCRLYTFGHMSELISVRAGGSRQPYTPDTYHQGLHHFTMDGRSVREFVMENVPDLVKAVLYKNNVLPSEIDHVIPHQANGRMLDEIIPKFGMHRARVHTSVAEFGNTGGASIPITLDQAARSGALHRGEKVLLVGFGGGMSAGVGLIEWSR
ncbi:3-oxoacyl-ACP synthase III family protein [Nocardia sp. NPDC003482]